MKGQKWTTQETEFLRENFEKMTHKEMAEHLPNRTVYAVKVRCQKNGFIIPKFQWTEEKKATLIESYENTNSKDLAEKLGCTLQAVYRQAYLLGLNKSKEWIADNARENMMRRDNPAKFTQFQKGFTPWNKGKKIGVHPGSEKGHFKKNHKPHNTAKVGDESTVDGYIKVKIAEPNKWKWKHRKVWEENNGKIPKNHCVVFKDGNSLNCEIENLELITRKQLALRNSIHNLPPEIVEAKQMLGRFQRQINKLEKEQNAEK